LQKLYGYGYNIYATELPNHGINNSSTKQCTFNEYVDYMETYIKKLNLKKVVLIGHSMGGGIISVLSQRIENLSAIIFISGLNKTVKQNIIARGLNMMKSGGNIFNTMKK
jgi:pimeloyl-ACP methyl ester carboxylesterase